MWCTLKEVTPGVMCSLNEGGDNQIKDSLSKKCLAFTTLWVM